MISSINWSKGKKAEIEPQKKNPEANSRFS